MAKIVEFYSNKLVTKVSLSISYYKTTYNTAGIGIQKIMLKHKKIAVCSSIRTDINGLASDSKLRYCDSDGFLFISTNGINLFGASFIPSTLECDARNIHKISVEGNIIFEYDLPKCNSDILKKIDLVHGRISLCDGAGSDTYEPTLKTIMGIKKSYENTSVISKEDLSWLNMIYNKFK